MARLPPPCAGALKLVGESFPFARGSTFLVCADNHNSVNGMEGYATPRGATTKRVPLRGCQMDDAALHKLLKERKKIPSLFAYPGQSNLTGVQHSLGGACLLRPTFALTLAPCHQVWRPRLELAPFCVSIAHTV